ncbi:MAG: 3-hydroxy-5-phosphonooxypentane-2,4-dione thiolase [Lachnospiraceae bacterium]|nr:3-hydroxy-5-phosphonooxypentane-2,4-dione thiolase [Lachnospiraceae bacterium]
MADAVGNKKAHNYYLDVPPFDTGFHAKGLGNTDWGMKNRLSRIFDPKSGHTVMLAFDHGYMMGPTAGLERMDVTIEPLAELADVLMCTRGALRTNISPTHNKAVCIRGTHDTSVLFDDMSTGSGFGLDIEDCIRLNVSAIAIQCFVGGAGERDSLETLCRAADAGARYGIPILGVTAVGKEMARTPKYFGLASRMLAELGASFVKTYYTEEGFDEVVAACPVPIVIAGGKKLPEDQALEMAYRAIAAGACGVDMGRNVFQSEYPIQMMQAIRKVVHEGFTGKEAFEFYQDSTAPKKRTRKTTKK